MLTPDYNYALCVHNSERVAWKLDDVMPPGARLDFSYPFLPEALARTQQAEGLNQRQRLALNHIMGNAYLNLFAFVEEYIIAMAAQHAHAELFGNDVALRALLRFSDEEIKHQQLFRRYRAAFEHDFGPTQVLENAVEVAGVILGKAPLAVMLVTLHLELVTQHHYVSSVRRDDTIDPMFASLLQHHWIEEAQHAKIDVLELRRMLETATPEDIDVAIADYLEICTAFTRLLEEQAAMDVDSLGKRIGGLPDGARSVELVPSIAEAYRHMFLRTGMEHPRFRQIVASISPPAVQQILEQAATL